MPEHAMSMHYVGTYPAESSAEAMHEMMEYGGDALHTISDGETGSRKNWVVGYFDRLSKSDAFEFANGSSTDYLNSTYETWPVLQPTRELEPADMQLTYVEDALEAYPILKRIQREHHRPDLKLQVGMPHVLDLSLFAFGDRGFEPGLLEVCRAATLEQIRQTHEVLGDDVVFQLETPASLSMALQEQAALPEMLHPAALGAGIAAVAAASPENARFGVHLCLGDWKGSRGHLASRAASVALINEVAKGFADNPEQLTYVHEPIAAGAHVPSLHAPDYEPLKNLRLPAHTRYIAGFVHEDQLQNDQFWVRNQVLANVPEGQPVGVATACGLGRRDRSTAQLLSQRMHDLVTRD